MTFLEKSKPDSDVQCVWREGKGETTVFDLGKLATLEQCIADCHVYLQNHKGVNGATYGVEPLNKQDYKSCFCIHSDGNLDLTGSNQMDFTTCLFPMPGSYLNFKLSSIIHTHCAFLYNVLLIYIRGWNFPVIVLSIFKFAD